MEGERDEETGRQTDRQTGIARICRVSCALLCCLCFVVYEWERETSNGDSGNPQSPSLSFSLSLPLSFNVFKYLHFYCEPGTRCACFASLAAQPHCSSRLTEICGGSVAWKRKRMRYREREGELSINETQVIQLTLSCAAARMQKAPRKVCKLFTESTRFRFSIGISIDNDFVFIFVFGFYRWIFITLHIFLRGRAIRENKPRQFVNKAAWQRKEQ